MNLSAHLAVWFTAIALVGMAPSLVRAYATRLTQRSRARADLVASHMARALGQQKGS